MATKNLELFYQHRPITTLSAFKAIDTTNITDGVITAYSDLGLFYLDKDSTATANDITIIQPTTGAGRWLRSDIKCAIDQSNIIYVGKHGNDSNSGKNIESAKLTFAGATSTASSGDVIACLDFGTYSENLSSKSGVNLYAPNANIIGNHVATHPVTWNIGHINSISSGVAVTVNAAVTVNLISNTIISTGTASNFLIVSGGTLNISCPQLKTENGFIYVDISAGASYLEFEWIEVTGTGTVMIGVATSNLHIRGSAITDQGAGTLFSSTVVLTCSINVARINMNTLSTIVAGTTCNLVCGTMQGNLLETGAGKIRYITPQKSVIGQATISDLIYPVTDGTANQVIKTDGAGNLGFTTVSGTALDQIQTYYFSKAGDNGNNGKSEDRPFLTFQAAIAAANAETPASNKHIKVKCIDSGIYVPGSSTTIGSFIHVDMSKAELEGDIVIHDDASFICRLYTGNISNGTTSGSVGACIELRTCFGANDAPIIETIDTNASTISKVKIGTGTTASNDEPILLSNKNSYMDFEIDEIRLYSNNLTGLIVNNGQINIKINKISKPGGVTGAQRLALASGATVYLYQNTQNTADTADTISGTFYPISRELINISGLQYPTADGSAGDFIKTNGSGILSFDAAVGVGKLLGYAWTGNSTPATTSAIIPNDNTKPQITEGSLLFDLNYTTKSTTSFLTFLLHFQGSASTPVAIFAFFIDNITNAFGSAQMSLGNTTMSPGILCHHYIVGSIGAHNYKIRVGLASSGTLNINRASSLRFDGTVYSHLHLLELEP